MILRPDHQERHQIWICFHLSRCPDSPAADVGSSPDKGGGGCEGGDGAASGQWCFVLIISASYQQRDGVQQCTRMGQASKCGGQSSMQLFLQCPTFCSDQAPQKQGIAILYWNFTVQTQLHCKYYIDWYSQHCNGVKLPWYPNCLLLFGYGCLSGHGYM